MIKLAVEKEPLTEQEFENVLKSATKKSEEARKVILLLRYTGMHVSILCKPKQYNLHTEGDFIIWKRTKKNGKDAETTVKIHSAMNFDVKDFIKNNICKRRSKNNREYFYQLVRDVGLRAGIKSLSPMSLRHTFAVSMLDAGYPEKFVQQVLNCSDKVLKTYLNYSKERSKDLYDKIGW